MEKFQIHFEQEPLQILQHRIDETRWPKICPYDNWKLGVDENYLWMLLSYWP